MLKSKELKIKAKILLPTIGLLILAIGLFLFLIINLQNKKNQVAKSIEATKGAINLVDQLTKLENQINIELLSYRLDKNASYAETMGRAELQRAAVLDRMSSFVLTERGRELVKNYMKFLEGDESIRSGFIAAVRASDQEAAALNFKRWESYNRNIDAALSDMVVYNTSLLDNDIKSFNRIVSEARDVQGIIVLCAITVIILLYFYLERIIVDPLKALTEKAEKIAGGELRTDIIINSTDEMGHLDKAMNDMVIKLKHSREDLKEAYYRDALTGLPNRQYLAEKFELASSKAARSGKMAGILLLDLDRFKSINDAFGHVVGDEVLKETAGRLKSCVKAEDSVIRLGGDEFVILISEMGSPEEGEVLAKKILDKMRVPVSIGEHLFNGSASIGVALFPNDAADMPGLLKNADIALYEVKGRGRNGYQLYGKIKDWRITKRAKLEQDLSVALQQRQIKIFYQPIIDLKKNAVISTEALARWQHPGLGMILPKDFIPIAEDSGLIVPIGEWVIKEAFGRAAAWKAQGMPPDMKFSINLSARQFLEPNLVSQVSAALTESGLKPWSLEIEITESAAMENIEQAKIKLSELSDMGIEIVMDDFGTGHSSLSYLKSFPIKKLKIDRTFIRDLLVDEHDAAITRAMISMAHSLNLKVVAEGVEQESQLNFLKSLGCDAVQGNFICAPRSAEGFQQWLGTYQAKGLNPVTLPPAVQVE